MVIAVRESLPAEDSLYILREDDSIDYWALAKPRIVSLWRKPWGEKSRRLEAEIFKAKEALRVDGVAIARKFFDDNPTVDLVKSMRKATLKDFGDHPYIPSHKLDVGPVKSTGPRFAQTQETFLGDTAGYYLSPSYGIDGGLVEHTSLRFAQTQEGSLGNTADYYPSSSYGLDVDQVNLTGKDIGNHFTDHRLIPSHELDISAVKPVTDAFTWIQEIISNTIWDYHSVPSYELHGGLVKTITKVIAWIKGGIDAFDNIVSLFHWGYKQGSAVVGEKAIVSGNHVSFFIDPNDTVLSKLLAAIDIGQDLFNKSIDSCFDVKTKSHGELSPIFL